jgi:sulfur carrier protein ThiS
MDMRLGYKADSDRTERTRTGKPGTTHENGEQDPAAGLVRKPERSAGQDEKEPSMTTILFNAFSFLQKRFRDRGLAYSNVTLDIPGSSTPRDLLDRFGLTPPEVEAVFVNGSIVPFDTPLKAGDRVAFIPPGTPGPYRVHLGMVKPENRMDRTAEAGKGTR